MKGCHSSVTAGTGCTHHPTLHPFTSWLHCDCLQPRPATQWVIESLNLSTTQLVVVLRSLPADRVKEAAGRVDILVLCAAIAGKPYKLSPQVRLALKTKPFVSSVLNH